MPDDLQPGLHLSTDQLSAFAENALPEHERLAALTHLSACADCRQIVFLAQQADPTLATTPVAETPRRSWLSLPQIFVASGAALACTLILALIVHLRPGQNQPAAPVTTAQVQPPPALTPQPSAPPTPAQAPSEKLPSTNSKSPQPLPKILPTDSLDAPPSPAPKPAQVQMAQQPATMGAMGAGTATNHTEAKMADRQSLACDSVNSGSAFAAAPPPPPTAAVPRAAEERQRAAVQNTAKAQNNSASETVTVSAASSEISAVETTNGTTLDAATIQDLPLAGRNTTNFAALAPGVVGLRKLPSKKPIASQLNAGSRILALDTAGALFLTTDNGKHWHTVAPQWTGKAVQLSFAPSPARLYLSQPQSQTQTLSQSKASPQQQPQQTIIPTAGFQLSTDTGTVWISTDGLTWHPR